MYIGKAGITAVLRSRGLHAKAEWVDRELPDLVDTDKNSALLQMLGDDAATFIPVDGAVERG
jgi:hypothetical protein